jgi:NAD(P)-dependent dehydrogenase (short-subunit alcohol dehydrogenase family)
VICDLAGKSVLLTGALGSLGRAQAAHLGAAGARLLLSDLPDDPRAPGHLALLRAAGIDCDYLGLDLADLPAVATVIAKRASTIGGFDILINNAAVIINKPFEAFTLDEYETQIRVNSSAPFVAARAVCAGMRQRGGGCIINFSSLTRHGHWAGYTPYSASKGAIMAMTKTLARELGPDRIRVNAVTPGAVQSEAEDRVFGHRLAEYSAWVLERQCLQARVQPDDIARLVVFLASDHAAMITGQEINVDGGW